MQILMTEASRGRVEARLRAMGQAFEIVTVAEPDVFLIDGRPVSAEAVAPDVIWAALDAFRGLLPTLFGVALRQERKPWMQVHVAGIDDPVFKRLIGAGVRISKGQGQAIAISEFILAHALSFIVPITRQAELQADRTWKSTPWREVGRTRWTLIGYGAIGEGVARRIKPFGAHLTVVRRGRDADGLADAVVGLNDLPAVLPQTDVLVLACALNDETRGVAGPKAFAALKPGAILINVGRGGLVDEAALLTGLDRDQPAHAVLDVFETEPLPKDSPLWSHPKVRVSAHTSYAGDGLHDRSDGQFLDNLQRFLAGQPLVGEASPAEVGL